MTKKFWFESVHDGIHDIDSVLRYLGNIADAFAITGNTQMSKDLTWSINTIRSANTKIEDAISEHIYNESANAQKAIHDTFATILSQSE